MSKIELSTLKNVFNPKNIHLCAIFFLQFLYRNIFLGLSWLKWYFYTWKWYLLEEWTPMCERFSIVFIEEHLCMSWLWWCFIHLNMFSTRRIYTSAWVEKHYVFNTWKCFLPKEYTSVQVDKNGVFYTKIVLLSKEYTPLCKCF